jgi:hypothetical protein
LFTEAGIEIADRIQGGLVDTLEHLSDFPGKVIVVPISPAVTYSSSGSINT